MTHIDNRRKTLFSMPGMHLMDITNRPGIRLGRVKSGKQWVTSNGDDVLPAIEKYTHGDFYLSDFTVGFTDPTDLLMFKLTFKR